MNNKVEIHHYFAVSETYKKQEFPLEEKHTALEKIVSEYEGAIQQLATIQSEHDEEYDQLNQKKVIVLDKRQDILDTCEKGGLQWQKIKEKQRVTQNKTSMNKISDNEINVIQEISKNLKQLDDNLEVETVSAKTQEFYMESKKAKDSVLTTGQKYQEIFNFKVDLRDYEIPLPVKVVLKSKTPTKKRVAVQNDIKKIKKNIKTFYQKVNELEKFLNKD